MTQYRIPELSTFPWQQSVKGQLASPPDGPAKGDRYLVIATASGDWTDQEGKVAWCYNATGPVWSFDAPQEGWQVWDESINAYYYFNGSVWLQSTGTISANTTFYVAISGSDTTGDGSSGSPWASVGKALTYLNDYRFSSGVIIKIQLADGQLTEDIVSTHPQGAQIQIIGEHVYTKTITSLQSFTGNATTGYYPIINLNDVANIADGDYILIPYNIGKGTPDTIRSQALAGVFRVAASGVDTGNKRVKLYSRYRYGTSTFPTTTGQTFDTGTTVTVIKSSIYSAAGSVLTLRNGAFLGSPLAPLNNVVLCGGDSASNTSNYGIYLDTQGTLTCGASVGVCYCYEGIYIVRGGILSADYIKSCNNSKDGIYCSGGQVGANYGVFNGNATNGIYNVSSVVTATYCVACGNGVSGIDGTGGSYTDASSGIANENIGNYCGGIYAHASATIVYSLGRASYNTFYGLIGQTNGMVVGISAVVTYNGGYGIYSSWGGFINCNNATIQNNTSFGAMAEFSSTNRVVTANVTNNNGGGAQMSPAVNTLGNTQAINAYG